ncbi:MAG: transposase [Thiohalospira sp.]
MDEARRSGLKPFKRLALTLRAPWTGILNAFDSRPTNTGAEAQPPQNVLRS